MLEDSVLVLVHGARVQLLLQLLLCGLPKELDLVDKIHILEPFLPFLLASRFTGSRLGFDGLQNVFFLLPFRAVSVGLHDRQR